MQLSSNFTLAEMTNSQAAARNGLNNTPTGVVLESLKYTCRQLETLRIILGTPILVSSGYRSPEVNKIVKGAFNSQHVLGQAVDFTSPRFGTPKAIVGRLKNSLLPYDQLILEYDSWVHISFVEGGGRKQVLVIDINGTKPYK